MQVRRMYRIREVDGNDDDIFRHAWGTRVGVLGKHCGHRLQLRLMRAMEALARLNGWCVRSSPTLRITCTQPTISSLGLAEHALLAQGRKIAARPLHTFNCTIRPVAYWPPGLFAFWDQRLVAE